MFHQTRAFAILDQYSKTAAHLASVIAASDAHRLEFGFLAESVYTEFARKDRLYIAVDVSAAGVTEYAGHLMFDERYPRARIVQMFTGEGYRRQKVAHQLLAHLRDRLTNLGFTSIYASVAEDLKNSNAFWQKEHFYIQSIRKGGESRNRNINVRCHELDTPQLFSASNISVENPLGLISPSSDGIQTFLLDLNVVFDVSGPRRSRHADAVNLFQLERMDVCRLAVSDEMRNELHRTAAQGKIDPMEGFIDVLPSFPLEKFSDDEPIFQQLRRMVFPNKGTLSNNDRSDLRHIGTAIQHRLAGLITSDEIVLASAPQIRNGFQLEIVSPEAFKIGSDVAWDQEVISADRISLSLRDLAESDVSNVRALLSSLGLSSTAIASEWCPANRQSDMLRRLCLWAGSALIGYMCWPAGDLGGTTKIRLATDDSSPHAKDSARMLLLYLLEHIPQKGPRQIQLDIPEKQSHVREMAHAHGFRKGSGSTSLQKVMTGYVIRPNAWSQQRAAILQKTGIKLPETLPRYQALDQNIEVLTPDGNRSFITLDLLESLLSPVLFCLPNRPAVISPIQKRYSSLLLGDAVQAGFLPSSQTSLFTERRFLCDPKALKNFQSGTLIFFYESGKQSGASSIMWIARVKEAYHKMSIELDGSDLDASVLTVDTVGEIGSAEKKTVVAFDNIFVLPKPVSLQVLKDLGCGTPTKLLTTNPISDFQFQAIMTEAFDRGQH